MDARVRASMGRYLRRQDPRPSADATQLRAVVAHLGAPAGQAGARMRARTGALAGGALLLDGRSLGRLGLLLLVGEDLILGLALEQRDELLCVDGLAVEEDLGDAVELLATLGEDLLGGLVRFLDDAADLVVDLASDLVRVVGLRRELPAEERLRAVMAEDARAEALGHAEAHHHLLGRLGHLLEVIGRSGGDLAEDDLLRGAPAEGHRHRVGELRPGGEELVLGREGDRVAERLPTTDDRDLVDRIGVRQQVPDDRVPKLVIGGDEPLLLRHHPALLLRTGDHAHDPFLEVLVVVPFNTYNAYNTWG